MRNTSTESLFVNINGKEYCKISDYDQIKPFLFTLATSSDLWIHLSTYGGITAGRESSNASVFPYVPEDILHHSNDTGSKTLVKVFIEGEEFLWQPFDAAVIPMYDIQRNIYKSAFGEEVIFEEINKSLDITFRTKWQTSNKFGFVRTSELECNNKSVTVDVLDGLVNIMPYGVSEAMQRENSCMVDGYKRSEMMGNTGVAVYSLSSAFSDRPEAVEIHKATVVWNTEADVKSISFYEEALKDFAHNMPLKQKEQYIGERSCYLTNIKRDFINSDITAWSIVCDIGVTRSQIAEICASVTKQELIRDIELSSKKLYQIIAMTDGLQCTSDKMSSIHHASNVTYNDMRGGLFLNGYNYNFDDFCSYVRKRNVLVYDENKEYIKTLSDLSSIQSLKNKLLNDKQKELYRMCLEYIPVSFSRRHGDPSRPWNVFSIILNDSQGKPITYYEGNWRDIFRNWEALCLSYPEFYENTIVRFLNATTRDGYNSLKINKYGIAWETPEDLKEWSAPGYSSDHQIIYLVRLIERLLEFSPNAVKRLFDNNIFTYADSPYELTDFDKMIKNPKWTIAFNSERNKKMTENAKKYGEDFKLAVNNDRPYYCSFAEKLTIQALTKISNLVVGGGIWMNTQKPEWNDANNAIVGYGMSVVTTCQLRHYLLTVGNLIEKYAGETIVLTNETAEWLSSILDILVQNISLINDDKIDDYSRFNILSKLERCFDEYKNKVYRYEFSGYTSVDSALLKKFYKYAQCYIEFTIRKNKRSDAMYHSYNIMSTDGKSIGISHLPLMLEGQVAALDCKYLNSHEACALLESMKNSALYSQVCLRIF